MQITKVQSAENMHTRFGNSQEYRKEISGQHARSDYRQLRDIYNAGIWVNTNTPSNRWLQVKNPNLYLVQLTKLQ